MKRFDNIEVVGEPRRVYSSFVKGYETLPVRILGVARAIPGVARTIPG